MLAGCDEDGTDRDPSGAKGRAILLLGGRGSGKRTIRSILLGEPNKFTEKNAELWGSVSNLSSPSLFGSVALWTVDLQPPVFASDAARLSRLVRENRVLALVFLVEVCKADFGTDWNWIRAVTELVAAKQTPTPQRFVLIHKTDTVPMTTRASVLQRIGRYCCEAASIDRIRCFATSIWDASLYHAWSTIARSLLPEASEVQSALQAICDEWFVQLVVLFESVSLLALGHAGALLQRRRSREVGRATTSARANRWFAWFGSSSGPEAEFRGKKDASEVSTGTARQDVQRRSRWPWQKPERCASAPLLQESKLVETLEPFNLADAEAFEKMSLVLKRLRLACVRSGAMFEALELIHGNGEAFLETLTPHTFVLICLEGHDEHGDERSRIRASIRNALGPFCRELEKLGTIRDRSPLPQATSSEHDVLDRT
ncbi:hypothetical protein CCYA_CCYA03G0876 [Cyanidiococcus yangmingshanensis]|nr:hypothetical protein CCYA_CCYA03G0876 [Cyanidiococcus yangmingshanensis]